MLFKTMFVQIINQVPFVIGLKKFQLHHNISITDAVQIFIECHRTVYLRLPFPQQIEVRTIDDMNAINQMRMMIVVFKKVAVALIGYIRQEFDPH